MRPRICKIPLTIGIAAVAIGIVAGIAYAASNMDVGVTGSSQGTITLHGSTSGAAVIGTPAAAGTPTFNLPTTNGTMGQALETDGAGNTSWSNITSPTAAVYTSNTATLTIPAVINTNEIIRQGTPAALTVNLPASPATNMYVCVKDGGNNFATNNATVKTTDSTQIDGIAGSTGYVMNQNKQYLCFLFDGTMWDVL